MRRNEKSCVCNVFATPHSKNPVKSSVPSYQNVNFSSARDNFLSQDNSIRITTPQDFGSEEFFWLFVKSWGKFRNWRFAWDWRISNMSAAWRTESAAAPLTY